MALIKFENLKVLRLIFANIINIMLCHVLYSQIFVKKDSIHVIILWYLWHCCLKHAYKWTLGIIF